MWEVPSAGKPHTADCVGGYDGLRGRCRILRAPLPDLLRPKGGWVVSFPVAHVGTYGTSVTRTDGRAHGRGHHANHHGSSDRWRRGSDFSSGGLSKDQTEARET